MKKIYLDNAASTPIDDRVIDAMITSMKEDIGNPSATHSYGQEGKSKIEAVRKTVARLLNVLPSEIVFTSGGTESNNLIIRSCVEDTGVKRIITSPLEHKCVLETIRTLKEKHPDLELVFLPVKNKKGDLDLDFLEEELQVDKPALVSLMHANNEVGNLIDIKFIADLCKKYKALFHSDTVQTMGHYTLDFAKIPLDFASCSAHKFHGPKGAGVAFIRKSVGLKGVITGGAQERNMRAGTENVYGIIGLGKAFELAVSELEERKSAIKKLKEYAVVQLKKNFPDIQFNGYSDDLEKSLYTLVSITLPFPNAMVGFQLDMKGIAVSQGSACSSGAAKPSNFMSLLYSPEQLKDTTTLRISFSHYNIQSDIDELIKTLLEIQESIKPSR